MKYFIHVLIYRDIKVLMSYVIYHNNLRRTFREDDILIAIVPRVKNKAAFYF